MKLTSISLVAGAALLAVAGAAVAQDRGGGRGPAADMTRDQAVARADARFARLDANRDGRVTTDEARQARAGRRAERQAARFDRLDTNNDGSLSRAEFDARGAGRGASRGERRERRGGIGSDGRGGQRMAMRMFGGDGVATRDEFRALALQRFERLDANRDGTVTSTERGEVRERMREERRSRRGAADRG